MAENLILMQHGTKASASFTYGDRSFDSDEDGVISLPSSFAGYAKLHGFSDVAAKAAPKPLAKDAGGAKGGDKKNPAKPGETEDAGGAKGGDGK